MTTRVPVRVNSYMLPQGTRTGSAARPRLTTAMNCRNAATTVSATPIRPNISIRSDSSTSTWRPRPRRRREDPRARRHLDLGRDRLLDPAARGPLGEVGEEGEEVDDGARGHGLVAEHLVLFVGHVDSPDGVDPVTASCPGRSAAVRASTSSDRSPPELRSSPATSTVVRPPSRRVRTQIRRGRMNSEPSSPISAEYDAGERDLLPRGVADLELHVATDRRRR